MLIDRHLFDEKNLKRIKKITIMDLFCNKCTLQFGKKYVFDLHLSLVHGEKIEVKMVKNEPIVCDENFLVSKTKHVVDKHLKCQICDSSFKSRRSLRSHITSVHEEQKPFKCDICDASFTSKQSLNVHIASVHEGKKPFKCNICDYACSNKDNS